MTTARKTDEEDIHSQDHHLDTGTEEPLAGDLLHEKNVEETEICRTENGVDDSCVTVESMSDIAGSCTVEFGTIKNEDCQIENSSDAEDEKVQVQTSFIESDPLLQDISKVENYMSEKCRGLIEDGVADNEPEEREKFQGQEASQTVEKEGTDEKFASADSSLSDFHAGNEDGNENERINKEEDEMEMSRDEDSKQEDERSDSMEDDIGVADNEPEEQEKFQGQETSQTVEKEATEETYDASADSSLSAFHADNENENENENKRISEEEEEKELSCDEDSKQEDERIDKDSMNNCLTASDDGANGDDMKMLNCMDSEGQKPIGAENDAIGGCCTHGTTNADNFRADDEVDEQLRSRKEVESGRQHQTSSTLFVSLLKSEEMCVQGDEFEKSSHCSHEQSSQEELDEGSKRDEISCDSAPISNSAKAEMNDQSNTRDDTTYSDTDDKLAREAYATEGFQMNGKMNEQHQHQKQVLSVTSIHPFTQEQMQQKEGEQQDLMEKQDETNLCTTDVPALSLLKLEKDISPSTMHRGEIEATLLIKQQKNSDNHTSKEDRKDHDSRSSELAANNENLDHGFYQVQNHKRAIPPFAKFDHPLTECNGTDLCHHGASHFINSKNNESPDVQQSAHVDDKQIASFESKRNQRLNEHKGKQQQDASVSVITLFDVKDSTEVSDPSTLVEIYARKRDFINNPEKDARSEANPRDVHEFKGDQSDTLQPVSSEPSSPVGGLLRQSSPDPAISTAIFKHQQERDTAQEDNRMNAEMEDECKNARTKKSAAQQGPAAMRKPSNDAKPKRRRWIQCICCMCVT